MIPTTRQLEIAAKLLQELAADLGYVDESVGIGGDPESATACQKVAELLTFVATIKKGVDNESESD